MAQYLNSHGLAYFWSLIKDKIANIDVIKNLQTAVNNKLDTSTASNTYLTKTDAKNTYATKSNLSAYLPLSRVSVPNNYSTMTADSCPVVRKSDGGMEIGQMIDWHAPNTNVDYTARMSLSGSVICFSGHIKVAGAEIWVA